MDSVIIDQFSIYQYSLPLKKPLYVRGQNVSQREGFIVKVSANGFCGFGEAAPLEGLSKENMKESLAQLKRLQQGLIKQPIPPNLGKLNGGFKTWLKAHQLSSSAQFAIELAILNLLADAQKTTISHLMSNVDHPAIQINGLLQGTKEEIKTQARELIGQGFHSFKLKVTQDVEDAIDKVLALTPIIEGKAVLHIDVNQQWTIAQAVLFGHEVGLSTVDYIEEPFKDLRDVSDFFMKTTIPIALDETLQTKSIEQLKSIDGLEIMVIKPTVLGGVEASYQLIQKAHGAGMSTVISSCYESSVGILGLANLAGASSRHQGSGLDTLKWFASDVLLKPIAIAHGRMNIERPSIKPADINFEILNEVKP